MDIFETYEKLKLDLHMSASPLNVRFCLQSEDDQFSKTKRLYKELKEFESLNPEVLI